MIRNELLRDVDIRLEAFDGAGTVGEAEGHYRALHQSLIPEIYADNPMLGAAIELKFHAAIARKIARAGGVHERPAALLSCRRGGGREERDAGFEHGGAAHRRRKSLGPLP